MYRSLTLLAGTTSREQNVTRATHTSQMLNSFDVTILSSSQTGMTWRKVLLSRGSTSKDGVSRSDRSRKFLRKKWGEAISMTHARSSTLQCFIRPWNIYWHFAHSNFRIQIQASKGLTKKPTPKFHSLQINILIIIFCNISLWYRFLTYEKQKYSQ